MKIALCGSAPSSARLAPYRDASYEEWSNKTQQFPTPQYAGETWEVWGCSPGLWATAERASRWFETHRWEPGAPWFSPEYVSFLMRFRGIVYTGGPVPEIQNHQVYPIERVEEVFSAYFLHSSLSLMAAMAILEIEDDRAKTAPKAATQEQYDAWLKERGDVIGLWGVDMAANEEYGDQRSGCHFFILEALRRRIGIFVPPESCILRPKPVYGISEWDHSYIKATQRARELNARKGQTEQQNAELARQAQFLAGALDNHNYWINTWTSPYGIPAGLVINHQPGTGLGSGVTLNRPFSPGPNDVIDAETPMAVVGTGTSTAAAETTDAARKQAGIGKPKAKRPTKRPQAKRRK
jgi:hypothetical protein